MYYDFSWLLTTVVMSVIDFTIPTNLLAELPFDLTVTTWTATNVAWKLLKNLLRANLIVCFLWTGAQDMNLLCLIRNRLLLNILFKSSLNELMHIEYSIKNANSLFILGETKSVQTRKSLVRMLGGAALSRTNKLTSNWQTDPAPALCTFTPRREWGTRWLSRGGKQCRVLTLNTELWEQEY